MHAPKEIKKIDNTTLGITWNDGHESIYNLTFLRGECTCALCVDEWNGEKKIDPLQLPRNIVPTKLESVGHYGLQIFWDDGHSQGIYTYKALRNLCQCKKCEKLKA